MAGEISNLYDGPTGDPKSQAYIKIGVHLFRHFLSLMCTPILLFAYAYYQG